MTKRVFISCGQYTEVEKQLGIQIADLVRLAGFEPFFAEEVHDLGGLDRNIFNALHDCVAFITVLHPRGAITRPDKSVVVRASVWIEQEIAIAAYIQHVEKRPLQVIAFRHASVDREGLRDFLQLNPIGFKHESEILAALPELLRKLKPTSVSEIELKLESLPKQQQDGHVIRTLRLKLITGSNERISAYNGKLTVPRAITEHGNARHVNEIHHDNPHQRSFRIDEVGRGPVRPHDELTVYVIDYCPVSVLNGHWKSEQWYRRLKSRPKFGPAVANIPSRRQSSNWRWRRRTECSHADSARRTAARAGPCGRCGRAPDSAGASYPDS